MRFIFSFLLLFSTIYCLPIEVDLEEAKVEVEAGGGKIWVLLVAGSNGWYNYRHQADICHAYHILTKKHGISPRNVVTMMYNDIAYNRENPNPGVIINALDGPNLYYGIMIDYELEHVTPEVFLNVLTGNSEAVSGKGSGKVIQSTAKDYVFVNFVDHGASGLIAFPDGELHKSDLMQTLAAMRQAKKYKQMLFYVEACYSGSMFTSLDPTWNITAHTASNDRQSSYACVLDEKLNTYLGDCWSLNWMNNTDHIFPHLESETIYQQYEIVKKETTQSIASLYGDLKIIPQEPLSTFMGHPLKEDSDDSTYVTQGDIHKDAIQSQDVMVHLLKKQLEKTYDFFEREELMKKIRYHEETEDTISKKVDEIVMGVVNDYQLVQLFKHEPMPITQLECNKEVLSTMFRACSWRIQTHPYLTKYLYPLGNLCNNYPTISITLSIVKNCNEN